jgi:cell wall assembly regulator SMI1
LGTSISFATPASEEHLKVAERELGVHLPRELRELLGESDGVQGEYELALVWPLERIVRDNLAFRANAEFAELYMPFDHLLFFADAGNGDQFAHAILAGEVRRPDVFVWNHEDDSRTWVAPDILTYLKWWLDGTLKL